MQASRVNQIDTWFNIITRDVFRGGVWPSEAFSRRADYSLWHEVGHIFTNHAKQTTCRATGSETKQNTSCERPWPANALIFSTLEKSHGNLGGEPHENVLLACVQCTNEVLLLWLLTLSCQHEAFSALQ